MAERDPELRPSDVVTVPVGVEEWSEAGVDLTLIRWMLRLSPLERLNWLEAQANALRELRALAAREAGDDDSGV